MDGPSMPAHNAKDITDQRFGRADECGVRNSLLHQRIYRDGLTPEEAIEKSRRKTT
jgi:hypothetical protein